MTNRVLVIGDIHEPVAHPGYLTFARRMQDEWQTNRVVFIGDVVDFHGVSFHAKNPDVPGPRDEAEQAYNGIQKWYKAFPKAEVMIGNHDERVLRLANSVGITRRFIRDFSEVWGTPGWDWKFDTTIDDVYVYHGTGTAGARPAAHRAEISHTSTILGHNHTAGGFQWMAGPRVALFGMDTGCGIDHDAAAMVYGKHTTRKPMLGLGALIDGDPYWKRMRIAAGERYHRSRFGTKTRDLTTRS